MANTKFCGAIATQRYKWGYECVHCGQKVERTGTITESEGSTHKSNSLVTIPRAGAELLKMQAQGKLLTKVDAFQKDLENGSLSFVKNDDGRCPHCKGYQHWAVSVKNAENNTDNKLGGCLISILVFWGALIGLCIATGLVYLLFKPEEGVPILIIGPVLGVALTILIGKLAIGKHNKKMAAVIKELKDKEKKDPYFIDWGELSTTITGMSVR